MKTEDFERLRKLCDDNGFELVTESPNDNDKFFVVKKKDPWEGVEFVQEKDTLKIYKVNHFHNSQVLVFSDVEWIWKDNCKPSTEQAYVEQLKKEAFERFGEIKDGDRFELSNGIPNKYVIGYFFKPVWNYCKESDKLSFSGYTLYKAGKWAERVNERVKVVKFSNMGDINDNSMRFTFEISGKKIEQFYLYGVSEFLASQLEKYLNGEIE